METSTRAGLEPVTLSCSDQGNGHGYCAPVTTTVSDRSVTPSFISISTETTETASSTNPRNIPYPTGTLWQQRPQREKRTTRSLLIIVLIVGGLLLVGIVIGVWRWRVLRKRRGYPGWRMMGMFERSARRGEGGAGGARDVVAGGEVQETEMAARSSREELERITNSSGNARAAPVTVGRIDAVVAGGTRRLKSKEEEVK